jgi:hypothetical protein
LPDYFETRIEDDTLVAFLPSADFANLRFTVVSVLKDMLEMTDVGVRLVREQAAECNAELHEGNGRVWYHNAEPASEGAVGSLMHYWYVGLGGHFLVISCFVDAAQATDPLTQQVLASVEPAIRSFRRT